MTVRRYLETLITSCELKQKFAFFLFLAHLDVSLRRGYRKLRKHAFANQESIEISQNEEEKTTDERARRIDYEEANKICVPELGRFWTIYRRISTFCCIFNCLKYALVLLALTDTLVPAKTNCYLPGRVAAHHDLADLLNTLALTFSLFFLASRYALLVRKHYLELDVLVFLMHKRETIETEAKQITNINRKIDSSKYGDDFNMFPQNILQKTLFYELDGGDNRSSYQLLPNRTEKSRKRLYDFFDKIIKWCVLVSVLCSVFVAPSTIQGGFDDKAFILRYPSCCPFLEQKAVKGKLVHGQISFDACAIKNAAVIFDALDNLLIYTEILVVLVIPVGLTALIIDDLKVYWMVIDTKAEYLLERLRFQDYICPNKKGAFISGYSYARESKTFTEFTDKSILQLNVASSSERKILDGPRSNLVSWPTYLETFDSYILELQSLLCNFFDKISRADKLVNILLNLSVGFYITAMLLFGLFCWKIDGYFDLTIVKILFVIVVFIFVVCSSITLQLKRMTDRTYVNLCSIMTQDRSYMKLKWIIILEFYTFEARNSFTVFRSTRFTEMFVLNLISTSFSFLLAIATFRDQGRSL